MKVRIGFLLLLFILLGGCGEMDSVQKQVEERYTNADGLIHAYPSDPNSEYLSESLGLYMEYLLLIEDQETFHEQVKNLENHFLIIENDLSFVQWRLREKATTNALIDDIRIISSLLKASEQFGNKEYKKLATNLSLAIAKAQTQNGYTVDFYDWTLALPAQRLTLSYLNKSETISIKSYELLKNLDTTEVYFPEYLDTSENKYIKNSEVHMIDQLLIALNREQTGQHTELFSNWIKKEWSSHHQLYGRYNRLAQLPTVEYESLAVYYYLQAYFSFIGEEELAIEVIQHAKEIAAEDVLSQAHFFDYIHYQIMVQEQ